MIDNAGMPRPMTESLPAIKRRTLRPVLAFLGAFLGLGFSFVYVGELRLAITSIICAYGLIAALGWTGLLTSSATGIWVAWIVCFAILMTSAVWPTVIAFRDRHRPAKRYNRWWFYLLWLLSLSLLSLAGFKNRGVLFGYDLYRAPSVSMSPTIERGDYFLVDPWKYRHSFPVDGEIVVLDLNDGTGTKYVKRVVGVPGDRIELRDSLLIRNGQPVHEPYVHPVEAFPNYGRFFGPTAVVPPGQVFVLGDYRDNSVDSRKWGTIPISHVEGPVQFIWFSYMNGSVRWDRIGIDLRSPG
jgi:signal peptidase I